MCVIGLITSAVIVFSKRAHMNPDNIATPVAGSLGDIISLVIFANIAKLFHETAGKSLHT